MKKLRRSKEGKVFFGTCAGIGKYFDTDPVVIRILFLLIFGFGFFAYLIASLIIPAEEEGFYRD